VSISFIALAWCVVGVRMSLLSYFFSFFGGSSCIGQIGILMFGLFVHRRCLDMLFKRSWAVCR
jgi:hypothetical protein